MSKTFPLYKAERKGGKQNGYVATGESADELARNLRHVTLNQDEFVVLWKNNGSGNYQGGATFNSGETISTSMIEKGFDF